jgi:hypothetical protein
MLSKFSVLMMVLLIATAASLVGISSIIYKPANVQVQAQQPQLPQQLVPNAGQVLKKQPPIVTQQGNPQSTTGKIITQERGETMAQAIADKQLLDRLFPQIIKRIDGATLLQKIDAKTLAAKVLPHIQISVRMGQEYGPVVTVKKTGLAGTSFHNAEARCPVGTRVMGGGAELLPLNGKQFSTPVFGKLGSGVGDNNLVSLNIIPTNRVSVVAKLVESGTIMAHATCLGEAVVSLKP